MRHPFPVAPAGSPFRAALGVCLSLALLAILAAHRLGSAQGRGNVSKTAYPRCLVAHSSEDSISLRFRVGDPDLRPVSHAGTPDSQRVVPFAQRAEQVRQCPEREDDPALQSECHPQRRQHDENGQQDARPRRVFAEPQHAQSDHRAGQSNGQPED